MLSGDIALYFYLLNKANENDWRMLVHVAGRLLVPMLFGKSSLESARKRLIELGLIRCDVPKGNASSPAYYITGIGEGDNIVSEPTFDKKREEGNDEENAQKIISAANKFWDGFDEQAFNAKETALYFYLLHLAEKKQWAMPFRCFDAVIVPDMMQIRALEDAREILIQRQKNKAVEPSKNPKSLLIEIWELLKDSVILILRTIWLLLKSIWAILRAIYKCGCAVYNSLMNEKLWNWIYDHGTFLLSIIVFAGLAWFMWYSYGNIFK